jgi:hypothetical protein
MNHNRRIAVMLAGLAAVSAFSALPALAAPVPPPATGAPQAAGGQHQQCPSAVAVQPRAGKAWEHRRKVGGVGPAVGGWCLLKTDTRHMGRRI